jgi:predicted amidohydrolase YtcJ
MIEDPTRRSPFADVLIRPGAIHTFGPDAEPARALAVQGDVIIGLSPRSDGLDDLAGPRTVVIDDAEFTLLPAFNDTHNHLLEATRNASFVPAQQARSIAELVEMIRVRAATTTPGQWIQTSNAWHEQALAERRLPTAQELDEATREHPVIVRRGGHMAVLNSRALAASHIDVTTADPPGGKLGRHPDGSLDGMLEGGAQYALVRVPSPPMAEQIDGVERSCQMFAASGIGIVRDPVVSPEGMRVYQAAADAHRLSIRVRPLLLVSPMGPVARRIAQIDDFALRSGFGNDRIKVWGLKFVLDGGPEGGALDESYANDPTFKGHLNWEPDELFSVMRSAVRDGWRVATHAIGDRAVRTLLDVYERIAAATGPLPPRTFVIEHAFLSDRAQRARAIALGVHITVQHALLYALGDSLVRLWGVERTRNVMPVKAWLDAGAELSGGTDYPIGFFEPLRTVHGMVTRETATIGVQGPEFAIDRLTAMRLCTVAGADLSDERAALGPLRVGRLADLVAFRRDPLTVPIDELLTLKPAFTVVGGRPVHDPEHHFQAVTDRERMVSSSAHGARRLR